VSQSIGALDPIDPAFEARAFAKSIEAAVMGLAHGGHGVWQDANQHRQQIDGQSRNDLGFKKCIKTREQLRRPGLGAGGLGDFVEPVAPLDAAAVGILQRLFAIDRQQFEGADRNNALAAVIFTTAPGPINSA
jgi:hypothetical protein